MRFFDIIRFCDITSVFMGNVLRLTCIGCLLPVSLPTGIKKDCDVKFARYFDGLITESVRMDDLTVNAWMKMHLMIFCFSLSLSALLSS